MLRFPDSRRVPPPDVAGTARPQSPSGSVRAVVLSGARHPPRVHAFYVMTSPNEPQEPRTLVFTMITPPPGQPRATATRTGPIGVRAIVHPKASAAPRERTYDPPRDPPPPGTPRRLHFAASQILGAVITR